MPTPLNLTASSLNRLVCIAQTGVSSEGTTLKIRGFPRVSLILIESRRPFFKVASGALSPTLSWGPVSEKGFPLRVQVRAMVLLLKGLIVWPRTYRTRAARRLVASKPMVKRRLAPVNGDG
jgi:hypothetical protein